MAWSLPVPSTPDSPTLPCLKLRYDFEELCIPRDHNVPQHKRFFPKSCIKRLCTEGRIKAVLECCCAKCQEHQRIFGFRDPALSARAITGKSQNGHSNCAVVLFALLVYIECPSLIYSFLDKRLNDHYFESELADFTAKYVLQIFGSRVHTMLADRFHWNKYKFAVPYMKDGSYEEYPSSTILPFVNETRLGRSTETGEILNEGSYGTVFAFEILDEYKAFAEFPEVRRFARKQLRENTPYDRFKAEYDNLLFVKRLQDDHLVKIVKAYKHGEFYNFIFPCAKTNLGLYLREPHFEPFPNAGSFVEHPVWRQMLGLARGLHKVLDFEEPVATRASSLFGYHFDLKPANVLVEESDSLVISDFGQATFKDVTGTTSSKIIGMGGTEAYAPPEIDSKEIKQNRRYDIWSLGCIFVEVCTSVVKGSLGVLELDHIRSRKIPETNYTDDRFFWWNVKTRSYELKPDIKQWIQHLPQFIKERPNRDFLNQVLLLALNMLDVDVRSRLTSKEVCIRFSNILDDFQSSLHRQSEALNHSVQTPCPGVEAGKELMKKIQSIPYNVAGFWKSGPVRFMQEDMQLRIQTLENNIWVETLLGPRSQLRLVPRYALRDRGTHYFSDAYLYLSSRSPTSVHGKFSPHNFADVLFLQEILLGHEVRKSVKVKAAHVVQKQRKFLLKKFQRRRSSGSNDGQSDLEVEASSVQLWAESSHRDITDMTVPASSSRRQSPRSLRIGPSPRRIVIFFERSILIIHIAKNVRIKQPVQPDQRPTSLVLVPTDESVDPSFAVSVFRAGPEERAPSLPLTRDELNSEEMENSIECARMTLDFHNADDAESFFRTYKMVKKRWKEELKSFEPFQNRVGPVFGYARS